MTAGTGMGTGTGTGSDPGGPKAPSPAGREPGLGTAATLWGTILGCPEPRSREGSKDRRQEHPPE